MSIKSCSSFLIVLVITACGLDQDQDTKNAPICLEHGKGIPCDQDIYAEDLLTVHPAASIEALKDYLLSKKNLKKSSPFRKIAGGKGDLNDLLRGIAIAKNAYGINPLFALSLSALESKWGVSYIAKTKYNLWGWNAVDGAPGRATKFKSFSDGFNHVFKFIKAWYLRPNGRHHKSCSPPERFNRYVRRGGCSIKDCGASLAGMNCRYSSDPRWARKIRSQMNHIARFINKRCQGHGSPVIERRTSRLELPRFPTPPSTSMLRFSSSGC